MRKVQNREDDLADRLANRASTTRNPGTGMLERWPGESVGVPDPAAETPVPLPVPSVEESTPEPQED